MTTKNVDVKARHLRENQYYSLEELAKRMHCREDFAYSFVQYMLEQGVCRADVGRQLYSFNFVGLIEYDGRERISGCGTNERFLVYIVPKFFPDPNNTDDCEEGDALSEGEKIVLRAILKYRKEQQVTLFSNGRFVEDAGCSSKISDYLALILDVMENGIYSVPHEELVRGGQGEIDWDETFRISDPIFMREGPCYVHVITRETSYDEESYISRLEMCLVTRCLDYFEEIGLVDALGLSADFPNDSILEEFGTVGYCLARIENELRVQFVDAKKHTLRLMQAVLSDESYGADALDFQSFGMSGFHTLWERAIKAVFEDEIEKRICDLGLGKETETLKEYVKPPKWYDLTGSTDKSENGKGVAGDQLVPDFVAVCKDNSDRHSLIILDAKYYKPMFGEDGTICDQPGVGDVNKQVLYQWAYKTLPTQQIHNAFLFPDEGSTNSLTIKPFARIEVPILEGQFYSFKVNGLGLLHRYIENQSTNEARKELLSAFQEMERNGS